MTPFSLVASKAYAESLGLTWMDDNFSGLSAAAEDAAQVGFTQDQFDLAMRHHLSQVAWLFNPANYDIHTRMKLAAHFLVGGKS